MIFLQLYMQMDGKEVFKFAVSKVPEVIMEVSEKAGKTKEEIRFYMLHRRIKNRCFSVKTHERTFEKVSDEYRKSGGKYILRKHSASPDEWNKKAD